MKKQLLTTFAATLALAALGTSTASATQSRINSMGGGVKNFTVLDDRNIFHLPAELVKWGTWTGIEVGGPGFTSFGIHYNFNPTTVLAIYGTSENRGATTFQALPGGGAGNVSQVSNPIADTGDGLTHKLTAIFGVDLGTTRLGFGIALWGDKAATATNGGEDTNFGPLVIDILLGAGFAMGSADLDLGIDFAYRAPTDIGVDGADTGVVLSENSQIDIGLLGRLTVPFSGPHEIVAFLDVDLAFGSGVLTTNNADSLSGTDWNIALGTDVRLNLADGIIVQPGIGLAFGGRTITNTRDNQDADIFTDSTLNLVIPFYNVAVDVKVNDWLDIRFGGGQRVVFSTTTFTEDVLNADAAPNPCPGQDITECSTSNSDVQHMISSGVGFNLPAGVAIDVDVNVGWWQQGPYFLTGAQGTPFGVSAALSKDW